MRFAVSTRQKRHAKRIVQIAENLLEESLPPNSRCSFLWRSKFSGGEMDRPRFFSLFEQRELALVEAGDPFFLALHAHAEDVFDQVFSSCVKILNWSAMVRMGELYSMIWCRWMSAIEVVLAHVAVLVAQRGEASARVPRACGR